MLLMNDFVHAIATLPLVDNPAGALQQPFLEKISLDSRAQQNLIDEFLGGTSDLRIEDIVGVLERAALGEVSQILRQLLNHLDGPPEVARAEQPGVPNRLVLIPVRAVPVAILDERLQLVQDGSNPDPG